MKGISAVISVVLLLMITVALVGFAFVWFQDIWKGVADTTGSNVQNQLVTMQQTIKIDNIDTVNNKVSIRATGSQSIPVSAIAIFTGASSSALSQRTCTWVNSAGQSLTSIAPQNTGVCDLGAATNPDPIVAGWTVKATSPGTTQGDVSTAP